MLSGIKPCLKSFNFKLYRTLLVIGIIPAIYTTCRVFFIGQLPNEWAYSIAGQLSWVNLIYEILNESIILPLFYLISKSSDFKTSQSDKICTGMLFSAVLYGMMAILICVYAKPLLYAMAADQTIIDLSASYIRIESIANIFSILVQFCLVVLILLEKTGTMIILLVVRLVLSVMFDTFLISTCSFSLNLGVEGIGLSNILIQSSLLILSVGLLVKDNILSFHQVQFDFKWLRHLLKVGGISGLESLIRNLAYMVMISRMVNLVGEQGTYWVANSFIWTWVLLPVLQLGETIKKEVAANQSYAVQHTPSYLFITLLICLCWLITIPFWKGFMSSFLGISDVDQVFGLVMILMLSYVFYAFQNVFDSIFYGLGKTEYMLFESVVTNTVYYGIAFCLYCLGIWTPTLIGIALLFVFGNIFDSVVSALAYRYLIVKEQFPVK